MTSIWPVLILVLSFFLVPTNKGICSDLDYKTLTAEELEILYLNGHPDLLSLVCDKYFELYCETSDDDWLFYGQSYKTSVKKKFMTYCKQAADKGIKSASCNISIYYQKHFLQDVNLDQLIKYTRLCGNNEILDQLVQYDSIVMAGLKILAYIKQSLSDYKDGNLDSLQKRLYKHIFIFHQIMSDIKRRQGKTVLFSKKQLKFLIRDLKNIEEDFDKAIRELLTHKNTSAKLIVQRLNKIMKENLGDYLDFFEKINLQLSDESISEKSVSQIIGSLRVNMEERYRKYKQELEL